MQRSTGGGGSGAAFTAKRRAYGPGAQRWGGGWCSPQSAGFLVVIAGVWVTVLLLFGTALFVETKHGVGSSFAASHSGGDKGRHRHVEASELGALQAEVKGLSQRVDALAQQQARPALDLPPAESKKSTTMTTAAAAEKGLFDDKPKQLEQPKEGGKDSRTSPVPLVDPTVLTRSRPKFEHGDMEGLCRHRNDGDEEVLDRVTVWDGAEMGKPRIMCISFTLQKYHDSAVQNVRRTWGQKCDGYIAMSDFTDPEIPSVDIKHDGPEAYENMWQKIRAIWMYLHKHHLNDFDYFVSGGDDLFIIVENLRKYLLSDEIKQATAGGTKPIFLGRPFLPPREKQVFNSGGAGLFLNRKALEILGEGLNEDINCRPHQVGFWEDVNVANCLHAHGGVHPYNNTQDAWGRERFNPFTPGNHFYYRVNNQNPDWYAKYTFNLREGLECCSTESISFHYVKGDAMKRYYALVYGLCDAYNDRKARKAKAQAAVAAERAEGPPSELPQGVGVRDRRD